MDFPTDELERRLTEFQVAASENNEILGAIGIRLSGKQGQIHSEGFKDFGMAETLREALWQRLQSVAANHGLVRLWTLEAAPFWTHAGLTVATEDELCKLPEAWQIPGAQWLTLKLREDLEEVSHLDSEFAMFMEAEKARSRQIMGQAKMLKIIATLLALGLFLGVLGVGIWMAIRTQGS